MQAHTCWRWTKLAMVVGIAIALILGATGRGNARAAGAQVLPPNSSAYGATYGEWNARWEQWVFSRPGGANPEFGADCNNGQSGPVFFLAGVNGVPGVKPVTRNCTMPAGKALFFPLVNRIQFHTPESFCAPPSTYQNCDTDDTPQKQWDNELGPIVAHIRLSGLHASVDGVAVPMSTDSGLPWAGTYFACAAGPPDPDNCGPRAPAFSITVPPNSDFAFGGDPNAPVPLLSTSQTYSPAVAAGFYVMLAPLPAGQHVIKFGGTVDLPTPPGPIVLDLTYNLTVSK